MKSKFQVLTAVAVMATGALLVFSQYRGDVDLMLQKEHPIKPKLFDESSYFQHDQAAKIITESRTLRQRLPQIIGIGSKKCGTGAFRRFLSFHSRVSCPKIDEAHYFDEKYDKGVEFYKTLMPLTTSNEFTFEKTPKYIVTKEVPQRIIDTYAKEVLPTPKFVWVVCDPVQRAFSDFTQAKRQIDDPEKESVVGEFNSFDDYVTFALAKIEALAPPSDTVYDLYKCMDSLHEDRKLRFLLRGIYSYYFQHWLNVFPLEDFVIISGDELLINPGEVMVEAQEKLDLEVEIKSKNFVYVPKKGLYCVKMDEKHNSCLGENKGNTRKIVNGTVAQSALSGDARRKLEEFYEPFMQHFRKLTQQRLNKLEPV